MSEDQNTIVVQELVSIIVPVYNAGKTLGRCLESVLAQSHENIELLIINDGSTDDSGEIAKSFGKKNNKIKLFTKENSGPAAARNVGLENAKGQFIFLLDADDYIEKDAIALLVKCQKDTGADIVIGGFNKTKDGVIQERKDIVLPASKLLDNKDLVAYARAYLNKPNKNLLFAFSWGRLFKRSVIKDNHISFDTALHTFEDVAFNFEYLKYSGAVYFFRDNIYNHAISDNYLSATMSIGSSPLHLFGYRRALEKIQEYLDSKISPEEVKKETGHAYVFLTIIQFVRACGQINMENKKIVEQTIRDVIREPALRRSLSYYLPSKGDSKILPFLMKLKLVRSIILVCKYKARKRYSVRRAG